MSVNGPCPIWDTPTKSKRPVSRIKDSDDIGFYVDSPRAGGKYFVDGRSEIRMSVFNDREKARLTTWMIRERRLGVERPEIWSYENYIESITRRPPLSVHDRAVELLKYIQIRSPHIGFDFELHPDETELKLQTMEMLAYTESVEVAEVAFLREYLLDTDLVNYVRGREGFTITISAKGYAHLAKLEQTVIDSSQVFVAMWFDDSLKDVWSQGIKPAIENAGYKPVRIDNHEFIGKIDDRIIAEIKRSRFVVADFTQGKDGARGGVYYEAGFAHGLDIPVIFTCRSDSIDDVHFDTRQYNHIVWDSPDSLKERLENRIAAEIGDGLLKNQHSQG